MPFDVPRSSTPFFAYTWDAAAPERPRVAGDHAPVCPPCSITPPLTHHTSPPSAVMDRTSFRIRPAVRRSHVTPSLERVTYTPSFVATYVDSPEVATARTRFELNGDGFTPSGHTAVSVSPLNNARPPVVPTHMPSADGVRHVVVSPGKPSNADSVRHAPCAVSTLTPFSWVANHVRPCASTATSAMASEASSPSDLLKRVKRPLAGS